MADIGSQVVLTVCSQMVAVPNVLGRQQGDAESIITGAGLTVPTGKTASGKPCVFADHPPFPRTRPRRG
ncbi:MAG TPA: hypothetical protein VGQ05_15270 [Streptosporangiaceae bacterium]|jgi:hypothetical protein|nr:hypothetical protein [Streptosporangiaceae bacterium]